MTADIIKSAVTVPMALNMYGYGSDRTRIPCPIHNGKDANFSIRDDHWHCFVCGEGGDVITLVMKLFNLPFRAACERLNADFRLGIDLSAPVDTDALRRHRAAQERKKRAQEERDAEYRKMTDEYRRLWRAQMDESPASWDEMSADFLEGLRRLDWLEWWFEENSFGR
jgi:DNA primase